MSEAAASILLVDDCETERGRLSTALGELGYAVEAHPDYRGALALLESARPVECMVTALRLPKGTPHGVALGNMALVKRPGLQLFFIADDEQQVVWVDERFRDCVLMRPVDPQRLAEAIERGRCGR